VGRVLETAQKSESAVFASWQDVINERSIERRYVHQGMRVLFPHGGILEILYPDDGEKITSKDTNASSIVARFDVEGKSFLFTGDLPEEKERFVSAEDIDVLKVAHHGSHSSTAQAWIDRLHPEDAIISVGAKNRYGHPHKEVLDRLTSSGVRVLRSDELGTIIYTSPFEEVRYVR
jgi:competence protein ComEC